MSLEKLKLHTKQHLFNTNEGERRMGRKKMRQIKIVGKWPKSNHINNHIKHECTKYCNQKADIVSLSEKLKVCL